MDRTTAHEALKPGSRLPSSSKAGLTLHLAPMMYHVLEMLSDREAK